jgi:uncharacterized membrane protein
MEKTKLGLPENFEAAIAYSLPGIAFITGFALLILENENKFVRFHAMQSFILFGFYAVLSLIVGFIPLIRIPMLPAIALVAFVSWAVLIVSAIRGKYFKFPFIGEAIYDKLCV